MYQVYCTDCVNFKIVKIGKDDFIPQCNHEERPFYKEG